ncbi:DUF7331 family protein [Halorarius litoreus]|uniref:DUF7331 family protein n=1 Tax=Halorarius litoreus TaxID=2962676 RepID=UPI0020CFC2CD|nr:hypothetical protein [Halorarius litoreus]
MPESPKSEADSPGSEPEPAESDAVRATEAYETDEGVVFYDSENPTAWMQARATLKLKEMA